MSQKNFPRVFWVANSIEVLERFSYYSIFMVFGIYMTSLGFSKTQLGFVQSLFLFFSYSVPVISGTFADKYGFKKVLICSYLAYLPAIALLMLTRSFSGIALTMLTIGLAAGIFKPLIAGTIRAVTNKDNKTVGFGIFYIMVNLGASVGPVIAGKLRAISWNYAFAASAAAIGFMLLITVFFYEEPEREIDEVTFGQKWLDIQTAFTDIKFTSFIVLLGIFYWLPTWAFFNICALYIDVYLDTAALYLNMKNSLGTGIANLFSHVDENGVRRVLGETIAHTGYIIIFLQLVVSKGIEKFNAISTFLFGMVVAVIGLVIMAIAKTTAPVYVFIAIFLFALGEMISSPRIQEYITWIAPKEKAGLYMGLNFIALLIGATLSGVTYTSLYGYLEKQSHPEYVWYILAGHFFLGLIAVILFVKFAGEFQESES